MNNNRTTQTTLYLFNEEGIISAEKLEQFCAIVYKKSMFTFKMEMKEDIDINSTIYCKFSTRKLEFTIYDYGYVMKLEGDILPSIFHLYDIDKIFDEYINYYLSPSQLIENREEMKYPRGQKLENIGRFLDKIFNNDDYSMILATYII